VVEIEFIPGAADFDVGQVAAGFGDFRSCLALTPQRAGISAGEANALVREVFAEQSGLPVALLRKRVV
jgi:hypothetical protein